jgi:hypothetical protein
VHRISSGRYIVILTDIGKGTSVTNAAEQIATEIYNLFLKKNGITLGEIVWFEHYKHQTSYDILNLVDLQLAHTPASYGRINREYLMERFPEGTTYLGFSREQHGWTNCPIEKFNEIMAGAVEITGEL